MERDRIIANWPCSVTKGKCSITKNVQSTVKGTLPHKATIETESLVICKLQSNDFCVTNVMPKSTMLWWCEDSSMLSNCPQLRQSCRNHSLGRQRDHVLDRPRIKACEKVSLVLFGWTKWQRMTPSINMDRFVVWLNWLQLILKLKGMINHIPFE